VNPVFTQVSLLERCGTVSKVVFTTRIDRRDDINPTAFVYYGMVDSRIGAARPVLPEILPLYGVTDTPEALV